MQLLTAKLTELMSYAFSASGYDSTLGKVSLSNRLDLCQFQCNGALAGAKRYKLAPHALAQNVVHNLPKQEIIDTVDITPTGFINITLKDDFLYQWVEQMAMDPHLGIPQSTAQEVIVLDYGNPNVAKPLHVGHLRSAIIGESLKRLIKATGRTAIGDVHLGDWGLPMGLVIASLLEKPEGFIETLSNESLNDIYPKASERSKSDDAFLEKARAITAELQKGHPEYTAIWKRMIALSTMDIKQTFDRLGVHFDYWYGESDASAYVPQLIDQLKSKELLVLSEGAQVVEVAKSDDIAPMPPTIVLKSNGSEGYATTDIATIIQRQKDFAPSAIWYVVDFRQNLHFEQVFRTAHKAKLVPESTELVHLCFGTVNGTDGKPFKTRSGGVMQLSELLGSVVEKAYEKIKHSSLLDETAKLDTAEKIGIAAIKFGDLINHHAKDCIFDLDKFTASEGKTGVYLLYTLSRIESLLKKAGTDDAFELKLHGVYSQSERDLLLKLALSSQSYAVAYDEKSPHVLCESAYQIAVAFSKFYHENTIHAEVNPMKKATWLTLCAYTKTFLLKHLDVLAIPSVFQM